MLAGGSHKAEQSCVGTLVISVKVKFAEVLTNYRSAPGPGKAVLCYVGKTPARCASSVMLTTRLGPHHLGLEWSCESKP